jgi:hypothetical protein
LAVLSFHYQTELSPGKAHRVFANPAQVQGMLTAPFSTRRARRTTKFHEDFPGGGNLIVTSATIGHFRRFARSASKAFLRGTSWFFAFSVLKINRFSMHRRKKATHCHRRHARLVLA